MIMKIAICKMNSDETLTVIETKNLMTVLNLVEMEVYTTFEDKKYQVFGNINMFYIVIE